MKKFIVGALCAAAFVLGCSAPPMLVASGCEVTDKDRTINPGASGSDMRVYTTCGTFKVADTYYRKNSADTYGAIQVGETYTFEYTGTRDANTSRFPNIINATEEN